MLGVAPMLGVTRSVVSGVGSIQVVLRQQEVLDYSIAGEDPQPDGEANLLLDWAGSLRTDPEARGLVISGYGIHDRRVAVPRALGAGVEMSTEIEDLALGESRGMGEGVEGRLPPGRAAGLGAESGQWH